MHVFGGPAHKDAFKTATIMPSAISNVIFVVEDIVTMLPGKVMLGPAYGLGCVSQVIAVRRCFVEQGRGTNVGSLVVGERHPVFLRH